MRCGHVDYHINNLVKIPLYRYFCFKKMAYLSRRKIAASNDPRSKFSGILMRLFLCAKWIATNATVTIIKLMLSLEMDESLLVILISCKNGKAYIAQ